MSLREGDIQPKVDQIFFSSLSLSDDDDEYDDDNGIFEDKRMIGTLRQGVERKGHRDNTRFL